ncbi:MAG TPA: choice-of-anchor D domain-containing protein [Candidatus Kapabacteria bacterium]|nr:choice-of-anchor D domain-containing protein [Candidatus Kapabacteria bacterium]
MLYSKCPIPEDVSSSTKSSYFHKTKRNRILLVISVRIAIIITILACASPLAAQSLSVFDIDASNFPTMKAKFYAFDSVGNQQNPSPSEMTVTENGTPRAITSVNCPQSQTPKSVSSVLVMDISGSMDGTNIGLAKAAATTWVNGLPPGKNECALSSFNGGNYFNQDFTNNKQKLTKAIATLQPDDGTDYDMGLYLPPAGGLQVSKNGRYEKTIIFLTDGLAETPNTTEIINEANSQHCPIFVVTVGLPCPQCLKDISTQTGGMWFENIVTESQIKTVYLQILQQTQTGLPACHLTWESEMVCDESNISAQFQWNGVTAMAGYSPSIDAIARLQINPAGIYIRSKPINQKFDTTVTITAYNHDFTINNITSTNSAFDINPKSFSLRSGQTQILTISYTPPDSEYSWAQFDFQTDKCTQTYYARGGYPNVKPKFRSLKLVKPNGGEIFLAGSDTTITWAGIPLTDTVQLEYSLTDGLSWNLLSSAASSGKYLWHLPEQTSDSCLVRASSFPSNHHQHWVRHSENSNFGMNTGWATTTDHEGNIYITGNYVDEIQFDAYTLNGSSGENFFVAKYGPEGSLEWAKGAGNKIGSQHCSGQAIACDDDGNVYITGELQGSVNFEDSIVTANGFIAKYNTHGELQWVHGTAPGEAIAIDNQNNLCVGEYLFLEKYTEDGSLILSKKLDHVLIEGLTIDNEDNIFISGAITSTVDFDGIKLQAQGPADIFIAKCNSDEIFEWAKDWRGNADGLATTILVNEQNEIYACGFFTNSFDFDGIPLQSHAGRDIFFAKCNFDGSIVWVKQAGSYGDNRAEDMAFDNDGNIVITGQCYNGTAFGTDTIFTYDRETFVANVARTGSINWVKQTFNKYGDENGEGVTVDDLGNIFITGFCNGNTDFPDDSVRMPYENIFVYLWKVGDNALQSDTSDNLFSIVMPQAASQNIDMGKVFVAKAKDSVIQTFIRNTGTYKFRVDSIAIVGADASQFSLVSGIPPFEVAAGAVQRVEFRFKPSSVGIKSAQLEVITQADTLFQTITGEGILPTISVAGTVIDFGQISIGSFKDTTITVAIQNNGNVLVDFNAASQLGPDKTQFSVQSGGAAFTLAPGASQSVKLRFTPKFIGRTSGRIGFDYNGLGSPAVLNLFGQGLGGLVRMLDDSAYSGEHREVPMVLEKVPVSSVQSVATTFRARVLYDKTILYPTDNTITQGLRYDTVTITGSLGTDDVIARIPFVAMLGMSEISPMSIVDFEWLDASGNPADFDVETESGTFKILNICDQGGKRLYDPDGKVSMSSIVPNPTSNTARIEIQTIEKGRTQLTVTNILGQTVTTLFDGEIEPGTHDFTLSTSGLSAGSYFLTLRTPTVRKIQRLDIAK